MAEEVVITLKIAGQDKVKRDVKDAEGVFKKFASDVDKIMNINLRPKGIVAGTVWGNAIYDGLSGIAGKITSFIGSLAGKAIDILGDSISKAADLQEVGVAFEVMLGNADKAKELLISLDKFAATTPFNLTELQELTGRLLAFGFAQEDIIPTLTDLGNISAGVGKEKLPFLITALGQVRARTILTGEELRQFTNAQVPLLEELAKVTGRSVSEITGDTASLGITYDQVREALQNLSKEGGRFDGLMDRISKNTLGGVISNLEDLRDRFLRTLGGINSAGEVQEGGLLDTLTKEGQKLLEFFNQNQDKISAIGEKLGQFLGRIVSEYLPKLLEQLPQLIDDAIKFVENLDFEKAKQDIQGVIKFFKDLGDHINVVINLLKLGVMQSEIFSLNLQNLDLRFKGIVDPRANEQIARNEERLNQLYQDQNGAISSIMESQSRLAGNTTRAATEQNKMSISLDQVSKNLEKQRSEMDKNSAEAEKLGRKIQSVSAITQQFKNALNSFTPASDRAIAAANALGVVTPSRFAGGGIVPGSLTSGDRVLARVNSGEMILNKEQQTGLLEILKQMARTKGTVNNFNAPISFGGTRSKGQEMNLFNQLLMNL